MNCLLSALLVWMTFGVTMTFVIQNYHITKDTQYSNTRYSPFHRRGSIRNGFSMNQMSVSHEGMRGDDGVDSDSSYSSRKLESSPVMHKLELKATEFTPRNTISSKPIEEMKKVRNPQDFHNRMHQLASISEKLQNLKTQLPFRPLVESTSRYPNSKYCLCVYCQSAVCYEKLSSLKEHSRTKGHLKKEILFFGDTIPPTNVSNHSSPSSSSAAATAATVTDAKPIIDQEGRLWKSARQLGKLRRDGLEDSSFISLRKSILTPSIVSSGNTIDNLSSFSSLSNRESAHSSSSVTPSRTQVLPLFQATMDKHTLMLRDTEEGSLPNLKKGRFVTDDERWILKYDALVLFFHRYGHTHVPFLPLNYIHKNNKLKNKDQMDDTYDENDDDPSYIFEQGIYKYIASQREIDELAINKDTYSSISDDTNEKQNSNQILMHGHDREEYNDDIFYDYWSDKYLTKEELSSTSSFNLDRDSNMIPTFYFKEEFLQPYTRMDLGYWVAQQRYNYKYHNGTRMTPQRIQLLNELNFTWDIHEAQWEMKYLELKDFYRTHGHTLVWQNSTLGYFVSKQRYYKKLLDRRETVDIACIPKQDAHKNTTLLPSADSSLHESRHDKSILRATRGGGKVYNGKKVSPLTHLRIQRLNELSFVWDHWEAIWEEQYHALMEYQKAHSNSTRVPTSQYPSLGKWVRKLRAEWRTLNAQIHTKVSSTVYHNNCHHYYNGKQIQLIDAD